MAKSLREQTFAGKQKGNLNFTVVIVALKTAILFIRQPYVGSLMLHRHTGKTKSYNDNQVRNFRFFVTARLLKNIKS